MEFAVPDPAWSLSSPKGENLGFTRGQSGIYYCKHCPQSFMMLEAEARSDLRVIKGD